MSIRPLSMLLLAMAAPGCTTNTDRPKAAAADPRPASERSQARVAAAESPRPSESTADGGRPAPRTHVLRLEPGQACPEAEEGWRLTKPTTPPLPITPLPAILTSRYCVYDWSGPGAPIPPTFGHETSATYLELLPQGPAIGGPGGVGPSATAEPLDPIPPSAESGMGYFLAQQGAEFSTDASGRFDDDELARHRPYVAIVDSADAGPLRPAPALAPAPRQEHGYAMGNVIDRVLCFEGDPRCRQRLFYAQTFPRAAFVSEARQPEVALGSVADLSDAIIDAVSYWQTQNKERPRHARPPLILNLSVGWEWSPSDTKLLRDAADSLLAEKSVNTNLSAAEEYAFVTLAWASCQGALVIAAAGNVRTGACDQTHAMAPAAWEAIAAPSPSQCAALRGEPPARIDEPSPGPLVYAAGGVGTTNRAIANARSESEPARVLYSSIESSELGRQGLSTMTGTSIATASLSAIAAQLWATEPGLDAHGLMRTLDDRAALELARDAALHAAGRAGSVRRIRARDVVPDLYRSPSRLSPPERPRHHVPQPAALPAALPAAVAGAEVRSSCPGRTIRSYASPGAPSLPSPALWPELRPQPDGSICPMCTLTDDDSYVIDIRTSAEYCVVSPTVTLELSYDPPQGAREIIELPLELPASTLTDGQLVASLSIGGYTFGPPTETLSEHFSTKPVHTARLEFQAREMPDSGSCPGSGSNSGLTTGTSMTSLPQPVSDVITIIRPLVVAPPSTPIP